jgi:hypothetical protein
MPVLAQLSHEVKWDSFVVSDINLSSFLAWAGKTETRELEEVLSLVSLVIHRGCGDSPSVQVAAKDGLNFLMPQISCNRGVCDRCSRGASGYYFQWTSSRWTPRLAVLRWDFLARYPNQGNTYCLSVPFPVGFLTVDLRSEDVQDHLRRIFEACLSFGHQYSLHDSGPLLGIGQNGERIQLLTTKVLGGDEGRGGQTQGLGATGDVSLGEAGADQAGLSAVYSAQLESVTEGSELSGWPNFEQFILSFLAAALEEADQECIAAQVDKLSSAKSLLRRSKTNQVVMKITREVDTK